MKRRVLPTTDGPVDLRYVLLKFADGTLIDPRKCKLGIMARGHWRQTEGEPFAVCLCKDAEAPECESGTTADEASRQLLASSPTH